MLRIEVTWGHGNTPFFQFLLGCFGVKMFRVDVFDWFFQFLLGCFQIVQVYEELNNYSKTFNSF